MSATPPVEDDDRTILTPARPGPAAPSGPSNTLPIGTILREFEITGLIGEGGFGIVYHALDHTLQRRVALKEYMPRALAARTGVLNISVLSARHAETFAYGLKSFVNEARLLARFDHPSLLKVYRFWEENGTAYMVMPFYEGATLKKTLEALAVPPDERWLKDMLRPLVDAIAVLHAEQCFHRDIAPDNILILRDGRPMLLDFGAARRVIGDMTQALTAILKPGFAPIEQYAESPDVKQGPWTDIYALASVVYFAVAGKAPATAVARMMSETLEPLSRLAAGRYGAEFLAGIDRALALMPADRPQDVDELRTLWGLGERFAEPESITVIAAPVALAGETAHASTVPGDNRQIPQVDPSAPRVTPAVAQNRAGAPVTLFVISAVVLLALVAGGAFLYLLGRGPDASISPGAQSSPAPPSVTTVPATPENLPSTPAKTAVGTRDSVVRAPVATPLAPDASQAGAGIPVLAVPLDPSLSPATNNDGTGHPASVPRTTAIPPVDTGTKRGSTVAHDPAVERAGSGAPSSQASGPAARTPEPKTARCTDILQRASLGEPLTPDEQALLQRDCK